MSFRRLPFQFSTTDPVERQRELERRFGLPGSNMYVDVTNPLSAGAVQRETISPRLQHRVPIFVEGHDKPIQSSVDAMGSSCENKKPNVRIIPIEVEGAEKPSARHRTFSGPAGMPKQKSLETAAPSPLKHSMEDLSQPPKAKPTAGPRVHNIPIQIERADKPTTKKESPKVNGCTVPKSPTKVKAPAKEPKVEPEKEQKKLAVDPVENALKKIQDILAEFRAYETGVQDFCGTTKDKQYRYLDEMLTRCMLKLDDLDTMGNEKIRCARKSAVKQIQASIDLLESKANAAVATDSEAKQVTNEVVNEQQSEIAEKTEGSDVEMQEDVVPESQENSSAPDDELKSPDKCEDEMKENDVRPSSTPSNEDLKPLEVEAMSGTAEVLNQVIDKVEENDVEMQNLKAEEKLEISVDSTTTESEIEMSSAVPVDEAEAREKPIEELPKENSNDVPEVEMGEVQAATVSSAAEEQMAEKCDIDAEGVKSDTQDESASLDVEMEDVQNSEVNSTVLDSRCNSVESTREGTGQHEEQHAADSSQSIKDNFSVDGLAEVTTNVTQNCYLDSKVIDSANCVESSQN